MLPMRLFRILLALGAVACGEAPSQTNTVVHDSAGVRFVLRDGPLATADTLRPQLVYRHGFDPSDYEFRQVMLGRVQADGSAFVGDPANQELVRIAPDGGSHVIWATPGQGPGEIRALRSFVSAGFDSVWVDDVGNGKLMLLADGHVSRTVNTRDLPEVGFGLMTQGLAGDGSLLMSTGAFQPDFEDPWFRGSLVRINPDSLVPDTLGHFDLAARPPPGPPSPFFRNGRAIVSGGGFVVFRNDTPQLTWLAADGSIRQELRWAPELVYPTKGHWEAFAESLREDLRRVNPRKSGAELEAFVDEQISSYEVPEDEPLPLFGPQLGDDRGNVWLQPYVPAFRGRTDSYTLVSADGEGVSIVRFPEPVFLLDARGDYLLAMIRNELDVQGVAVFRMPRR